MTAAQGVSSWLGAPLGGVGGLLIVAGALWPAARYRGHQIAVDASAHAASRCLYPLWRDLVRVAPGIALEPDRGVVLDTVDVRSARWRRYRRVIEIRDGVRELWASRGRSVASAPPATTSPPPATDSVAAALVKAVEAREEGAPPPVAPPALPVQPLAQEVWWWTRVAQRYRALRRRPAGSTGVDDTEEETG